MEAKTLGPVCCALHIKQPKWFKLPDPFTRVCVMRIYYWAWLHNLLAFDRSVTFAWHVHTVLLPTAMTAARRFQSKCSEKAYSKCSWPLVARSSKLMDSRSDVLLPCLYTSLQSTDSWIPHLNCAAPCTSIFKQVKCCSTRQRIWQHLCRITTVACDWQQTHWLPTGSNKGKTWANWKTINMTWNRKTMV